MAIDMDRISLHLAKTGTVNGNFVVQVYEADGDGFPASPPLASSTIDLATVSTAAWHDFTLSSSVDVSDKRYVIQLKMQIGSGSIAGWQLYWTKAGAGGTAALGSISLDSGSSWTSSAVNAYRAYEGVTLIDSTPTGVGSSIIDSAFTFLGSSFDLTVSLHGDLEPFGAGWGSLFGNAYAQLLRVDSTPIILNRIDFRLGKWSEPSAGGIRTKLYTDVAGLPGVQIGGNLSSVFVQDTGLKDYTFQTVYDSVTGVSLDANTDYWIVYEQVGQFGSQQWTGPTVVSEVDFLSNYASKWSFSLDGGTTWNTTVVDDQTGFRFFCVEDTASPPQKATDPYFENEDNSIPSGTGGLTLFWTDPGAGEPEAADTYDVYFGTDFGGPDYLAAEDVPAGSEFWTIPEDIHKLMGDIPVNWLNEAQTYEWQIVSKNAGGETDGDIWEFTTTAVRGLGGARNPTPTDELTNVSAQIATLTWEGCEGSALNRVYMGLTPGNLSFYKSVAGTTLEVDPTMFGMPYISAIYWRVDTQRDLGENIGTIGVTGNEWYFITKGIHGGGGGNVPAYGVGAGRPVVRMLCAIANDIFWYEDII
jgi:hypothetical protein